MTIETRTRTEPATVSTEDQDRRVARDRYGRPQRSAELR